MIAELSRNFSIPGEPSNDAFFIIVETEMTEIVLKRITLGYEAPPMIEFKPIDSGLMYVRPHLCQVSHRHKNSTYRSLSMLLCPPISILGSCFVILRHEEPFESGHFFIKPCELTLGGVEVLAEKSLFWSHPSIIWMCLHTDRAFEALLLVFSSPSTTPYFYLRDPYPYAQS